MYVQGGRHSRGFESHLRQLILLWKSDSLGCALPCCLFDFSCFFLPSFFISLDLHVYMYPYTHNSVLLQWPAYIIFVHVVGQ